MNRIQASILLSGGVAGLLVSLALSACGGPSGPSAQHGGGPVAHTKTGEVVRTAAGRAVTAEAHEQWTQAVSAWQAAERAGWNAERCTSVAEAFGEAVEAQTGGSFAEAHFMAGLAHARCNQDEPARAAFNQAISANPHYCPARVQIGVAAFRAGHRGEALSAFQQAVRDDPQCTEGYVNLAILQRRSGDDAQVREALANLRRALAITSDFLPAFNEMALLYLDQAQTNRQMLDLAEVVCRQAQQLDANYAPIYNTWGLINLRQGDVIGATAKFQRATTLDTRFFEAFMNFGSITLSFRGYEDAQGAFHRAVELRGRSYEAHIGLGVALRGLTRLDDAQHEYERAIELDGNRPEAYFDLGVLWQDYRDGQIPQLERARQYFQQFLAKAGSGRDYASGVEGVRRPCPATAATEDSHSRRRRGRRPRVQAGCGRLANIDTAIQAQRTAGDVERQSGAAGGGGGEEGGGGSAPDAGAGGGATPDH